MKKKLFILGIIMMLALTACQNTKNETEASSEPTVAKKANETNIEVTESTYEMSTDTELPQEEVSNANIGESINIKDNEIVLNSISKSMNEDMEIIILNISLTNNGTETTNYVSSIGEKVFQDGKSLKIAQLSNNPNSNNYLKKVEPNTTLDNIEIAYYTINTNELEIEFDEWISLDSNPVIIKVPFPTE